MQALEGGTAKLAEALSMSQREVERWLKGDISYPNMDDRLAAIELQVLAASKKRAR